MMHAVSGLSSDFYLTAKKGKIDILLSEPDLKTVNQVWPAVLVFVLQDALRSLR